MNIRWVIYFIGILDNIIGAWIALSTISGMSLFIFLIIYIHSAMDGIDDLLETYEKTKTFIILSFLSLILFLILAIFTPSSKLVATIYLAPKIISNEEVQKIPDNALKLLNSKMEAWIEDIRKTEKSTIGE